MELRTGLLVLAGMVAAPGVVDACGGCFHPPPTVGSMRAQVVTDHRMVLSLSSTQTTLWDQIRYSGSPDEFVWVLPVPDGSHADVHLADNAFIDALDQFTAPVITGQLPSCFASGPVGGGGGGGGFGCASSSFSYPSSAGAGGADTMGADHTVNGMRQEVVGPYAVNIIGPHLGGDDLGTWLAARNFQVTSDMVPVLAHYAELHSDYVILRLRPGEGVQAMQPVRITLPGYVPDLPLQMITAGVANKVGLTLMIVSNGQMESQNFANTTLNHANFTFDYVTHRSNYGTAFTQLVDPYTHGVWVTESVQSIMESLPYTPTPAPSTTLDGGAPDVMDPTDGAADGSVDGSVDDGAVPPPPVDPYADVHTAFAGLNGGTTGYGVAVVTRLRTELRPAQLTQDLRLAASAEDTLFGTNYIAQTLVNGPMCPVVATPPPRGAANGCRVASPGSVHTGRYGGPVTVLGALGVLIARRVRRRSRRNVA